LRCQRVDAIEAILGRRAEILSRTTNGTIAATAAETGSGMPLPK